MKFRLIDLFVLTAAAALVVVVMLHFTNWSDYETSSVFVREHRNFFSLNLLVLTTFTLIAFFGDVRIRPFAAGYAAFGWVFLICVLRGSFGDNDNYALWIRGKASVMGMVYAAIAGLIANYTLKPGSWRR